MLHLSILWSWRISLGVFDLIFIEWIRLFGWEIATEDFRWLLLGESMRPLSVVVSWHEVVWFGGNISRHSLIVGIAVRERMST